MNGKRGIAFKLTAFILAAVSIIFLAIFGYNYLYSRKLIVKYVEENAKNLAGRTVNEIDTILNSVAKVSQNVAYIIENTQCSGDELKSMLHSVVKNNGEIYGATIAFEPYRFDPSVERYAPYFYKDSEGNLRFADLAAENYSYFYWDWYQIPRELERTVWSEPYFDEGGGNIVMSTCSVPFYRIEGGERRLCGIVTADISLSWLEKIIVSIKIAQTGYGFVITRNGTFVVHPDKDLVMNETIFSRAEERNDKALRELGRKMIRGDSGFVPFESLVTGKKCWMVYAPSKVNGWSVGVLFPQDELMADVTHLNRTVIIIGIAGFCFLFALIILIAHRITSPLRLLAEAAHTIATGNLESAIPSVKSKDEVGELAASFEHMKNSLQQHIKDLTETTAAKERIESELHIAHDIQMGILPKVFPPFPDVPEFDIYAILEPAREVGGDLFDFFFLDDDHLCFHVGDVSGKGVPASLFMAITKTLIKTRAAKGLTPDSILNQVNNDLSMDNPSLMFVTLFLAILDIRTGELAYCNGGHNPPYILRANGALEGVDTTHGMALGVMEDFVYQSKFLTLGKKDTLVLYTDGVTEAMDHALELFTEARLEEVLSASCDLKVKDLLSGLLEKIKEFSHGVEQTDDITMMAIRFHGA